MTKTAVTDLISERLVPFPTPHFLSAGDLNPPAALALLDVADVFVDLNRLREIPIAFWDERLSTSAVERFLIGELDLSRKRRAGVVDRTAAAWILQGALDRVRIAEGA